MAKKPPRSSREKEIELPLYKSFDNLRQRSYTTNQNVIEQQQKIAAMSDSEADPNQYTKLTAILKISHKPHSEKTIEEKLTCWASLSPEELKSLSDKQIKLIKKRAESAINLDFKDSSSPPQTYKKIFQDLYKIDPYKLPEMSISQIKAHWNKTEEQSYQPILG